MNAFMRGGFLIGIGAGAAVLSQVLHRSGFFYAALLQSLVLLAMTVLTVFVRERPGDALMPWGYYQADSPVRPRARDLNLRQIITELVRGLGSSESLRLFGAIALVYVSASVFLRVFSIHLIQQLGWPDASLSLFSGTYGTLGALLVVIVGGMLSDRFGNRRLLGFVMLFIGGFLLTFNLLAPYWSPAAVATTGLMIWYTFDPVLSVAAMPVLMAICRKDVEGSQFTAYMALVNLSDVAGAYLSGQALTWVSAPVIGFGCGVVVLASTAALVLTFLDSPRSRGRLEPAG